MIDPASQAQLKGGQLCIVLSVNSVLRHRQV